MKIYCIGVVFSLFTLVRGGVDFVPWRFYGLSYLDYFVKPLPGLAFNPPFQPLQQNIGPVLAWFLIFFEKIIRVPVLYIGCGVLLKAFALPLFYSFFKQFVKDEKISFFVACICFIASGATLATGGATFLWDGPVFNKTLVAALLVLSGSVLWMKNQTTLASLFFGLSYNFHLFNSLAAVIFLVPPLVLFSEEPFIATLKRLAITGFIQTLFLIHFIFASKSMTPDLIPLKDWYQMVSKLNDVYMFDSAFHIFPAFILNFFIFLDNREWLAKKYLQASRFVEWGFVLLIAGLILDHMHDRGFFLGLLSEILITIELRRGIWILGIVTFLIALLATYDLSQRNRKYWFVFLLHAWVMIQWSTIAAIALMTTIYIFQRELMEKNSWKNRLAVLIIASLTMLAFSYLDQFEWVEFRLFKRVLWCMPVAATAWLLLIKKKTLEKAWVYGLAAGISLIFINTVRTGILANDLKIMMASKSHALTTDATLEELMKWRSEKDILYARDNVKLEETFPYRLAKEVKKAYLGSGLLWTPVSLEPALSRTPVYFDPFWSYFTSFYSRSQAVHYENELKYLYGINIRELYGDGRSIDADGSDRILLFHRNLDENKVLMIMKEKNITLLVSDADYSLLKKITSVDNYFIYRRH